ISNKTHLHFISRSSEILGLIYSSPPTSCLIISPPSATIVRVNWLLSSCLIYTEWILFTPIFFDLFSNLTLEPGRELTSFSLRILFVKGFSQLMWIFVLTVNRGWITGISLITLNVALMPLALIVVFFLLLL